MSNSTILSLVLAGLLTAALLVVVILVAKVGRLGQQITEFRRREATRSDPRNRSKYLHLASISEQLAPLLPGFRYNLRDVQWVGGGAVDAVVWNGLEAGGDIEIVFLDLKPRSHARMASNERRIREAIAWKRVAYDVYRPPEAPLLMEALPPEMSEDEGVPFPGYQVQEADPQATGEEVTLPDIPLPFMNQMGRVNQPGA